jgi:transposase
MQSITTIGLDIAKSVFQVHGVDAAGQAVHTWPKADTPIAWANVRFRG